MSPPEAESVAERAVLGIPIIEDDPNADVIATAVACADIARADLAADPEGSYLQIAVGREYVRGHTGADAIHKQGALHILNVVEACVLKLPVRFPERFPEGGEPSGS
jgi:hypothetical protein